MKPKLSPKNDCFLGCTRCTFIKCHVNLINFPFTVQSFFSNFPPKFFEQIVTITFFLGPACFGTILLLLMLAFWMFRLIKHNKFFLYYAEGKDNHGVVEDHDAEVDTLCYKEIFKQRFHSQITFHNSF